jgi:hypothetical protein
MPKSTLDFGLKSLEITQVKRPDPIAAAKHTGQADADSQADLSELLKAFKTKSQAENARFLDATDSEFWLALCFQNRAQKEQFLRALDLIAEGDKYLDGEVVAEKLGVKLDRAAKQKPARVSRKFADLV